MTTTTVTTPNDNLRELCDLLWTVRDGSYQPEDIARLEQLVGDDPQVQKLCARYAMMCGLLHWSRRHSDSDSGDCRDVRLRREEVVTDGQGTAAIEAPCVRKPETVPFIVKIDPFSPVIEPGPPRGLLGTAYHGTVDYFSQLGPFSYLMATFIMLLMGLGASMWKMPVYTQVAQLSASGPTSTANSSKMQLVGRITGMVNCKWDGKGLGISDWGLGNDRKGTKRNYLVAIGDQYALSSGLLEITYDTGAKVILQGPCTYEVGSRTGGYLSVGKLTARVEKGPRSKVQGSRSAVSSPQSPALSPSSNPSLSTLHSPLFTIKTPTATVTDLGTEFGVEVNDEGDTTSHVFRGSIELLATSAHGMSEPVARVLHENESARIERVTGHGSGTRLSVLAPSSKPVSFVRTLPRTTIKTLDLVDVVAGGDGFSGRRDAGIDPTSGQVTDKPPASPDFLLVDDGSYHRVDALPLVDGVFVPDGRKGPVQVDSAGHTFGNFRTSDNRTSNHLWAGGAVPVPQAIKDPSAIPLSLGDVDYSSSGHGLLYMHANKGITFDLDAIRRANPGCKILRFRAVAGNTEPWSVDGANLFADLSVLIDGQMRLDRRDVDRLRGAIWVMVPITEKDRFLTLAATDGGDGIAADLVIFGDPRLELLCHDSASSSTASQSHEKKGD